jgi:ABC transporter substrate binding protein (PQQ-dependent alcohol dehydrogenase system)
MKRLVIAFLAVLSLAVSATELEIKILTLSGEKAQPKTFAGIIVEPQRSIDRAVELALSESRLKFSQFGIEPVVQRVELDPRLPISTQLQAVPPGGLYLLDLPKEVMLEVALALENTKGIRVNVSITDTELREELCSRSLFHAIPSDRMYFDALSQYLVYNGWRKVLLVHGTSEEDVKRKTELATSIKRFGATVEEERAFTLSHHPDDRDRNKPEFLTGQASYDVVAVVDSVKDYGRKIEFNTRRPRPVVGDVGLVPRAWHFALERYGAPQLNDRYRDLAPKMPDFRAAMTDNEFAAWASVKLVSNSLNEIHMTEDGIDLNRLFLDPDARVDLYKGTRGSFRDWNHQMRHPILLTTQNYVAGIAPMPKFLHPKYYVDTLGKDRPESSCQLSQ